jgi:hypothetical protein
MHVGACVLWFLVWLHGRCCVLADDVALVIQHATRSHIAICGLWTDQFLFSILSQTARLSKKITEHMSKMRVLISSTTLFEIFLILRVMKRDSAINVKTSSCKVSVIFVRF